MTRPVTRKALTRITKVRFANNERTIFGGVLLKDAINLKSAKVIVQVDVPTQSLPVEAAVGQVWELDGPCTEEIIENNGYKIRQAVWRNPTVCELKMPATDESLIQFLADDPDFRGIGSVKARKLVQALGNDLVRLATSGDREAFRKHLTNESIDALIDGFQKYKNLRHAQFLSNHGIPLSVQHRLFKAHGESAVEEIKRNPYSLLTFGLPFEKTEKIASQFGIATDDPRRFAAATEQALIKHCRLGHTFAAPSDLKRRIGSILSTSNDSVIARALEAGKKAKFITYDRKKDQYHNTALHVMERVVAKRLRKIGSAKVDLSDKENDLITKSAMALPFPIAERQSEAVEMSLSHGLSCVIGGAGTGKTTVLRTTIECYRALNYNIYAMALSGRAATRLHESIGIETMTIAGFLRNVEVDDKPTLIVIDEASMLDLPTLYQIIIKTTASIRLLLVGDPHQLPPIGAGLPLQDIINSGACPVVELDIVQRQDETTGIPDYSLAIRNGELPLELTVGRIYFHEAASREDIIESCTELLAQSPRDSKVVAPTKALTKLINNSCQEAVNPNGSQLMPEIWGDLWSTEYRVGDPIMCLTNDYENDLQNGSLGRLLSADQEAEDHLGLIKMDDKTEVLTLTKALLDNIQLGYAMTLHKTQGSQVPKVIIALDNSPLVDRSWIYTAITRAEQEVHIIGSKSVMRSAVIRNSAHHSRMSYLADLLTESAHAHQKAEEAECVV